MTTPAAVTEADRIAAAVLACPSVARLHGGPFGEVATYLPGRRIPGIRHDDPDGAGRRVTVHVVGRYPATVTEIGAQVRAAVTAVLAAPVGLVVDVTVEDYLTDPFIWSDLS